MKALIKKAEQLASFLITRHRRSEKDGGMENDSSNVDQKKRRRARSKSIDESHLMEDGMDEGEEECDRLTVQPSNLKGGQLKDYQLIGLNWMISLHDIGINGILADEMGLGKTIQTIAFLAYLKEKKKMSGPHLIVAPNSTLGNWFREFRKWLPNFRTVRLNARKEYRDETFEKFMRPGTFDVVITSYEGVNICKSK